MGRLILLLLLAVPVMASADEPAYQWIGYRCDAAAGRLTIAFLKPDGDAAVRRGGTGWKTWDVDKLVSMEDENYIGKLRTITARCRLGRTRYAVELGPDPQNMNIQGRCGAADFAAWTAVRRDGKPFLPRTVLGPTCFNDSHFITEVVITADSAEPAFTYASEAP